MKDKSHKQQDQTEETKCGGPADPEDGVNSTKSNTDRLTSVGGVSGSAGPDQRGRAEKREPTERRNNTDTLQVISVNNKVLTVCL